MCWKEGCLSPPSSFYGQAGRWAEVHEDWTWKTLFTIIWLFIAIYSTFALDSSGWSSSCFPALCRSFAAELLLWCCRGCSRVDWRCWEHHRYSWLLLAACLVYPVVQLEAVRLLALTLPISSWPCSGLSSMNDLTFALQSSCSSTFVNWHHRFHPWRFSLRTAAPSWPDWRGRPAAAWYHLEVDQEEVINERCWWSLWQFDKSPCWTCGSWSLSAASTAAWRINDCICWASGGSTLTSRQCLKLRRSCQVGLDQPEAYLAPSRNCSAVASLRDSSTSAPGCWRHSWKGCRWHLLHAHAMISNSSYSINYFPVTLSLHSCCLWPAIAWSVP